MTFCTRNRRKLFLCASVVDTALSELKRVAEDERFALLAYCLMPDHVHLLVEGTAEDSDLGRLVSRGKQRAAYALWTGHGLDQVWQEGYHDWVLRSDQSVVEVIRYVLDNPVRAGLAARWDEYPFSGSIYPLV